MLSRGIAAGLTRDWELGTGESSLQEKSRYGITSQELGGLNAISAFT